MTEPESVAIATPYQSYKFNPRTVIMSGPYLKTVCVAETAVSQNCSDGTVTSASREITLPSRKVATRLALAALKMIEIQGVPKKARKVLSGFYYTAAVL